MKSLTKRQSRRRSHRDLLPRFHRSKRNSSFRFTGPTGLRLAPAGLGCSWLPYSGLRLLIGVVMDKAKAQLIAGTLESYSDGLGKF